MPNSLREFLSKMREPCPDWLLQWRPGQKSDTSQILRQFMSSRVVYYPGSGFDGDPVAVFNVARAAHCFIYVDYLTEHAALRNELRERGFRGYSAITTIKLKEADFGIGAWVRHARGSVSYPFPPVQPYGFLEIFERMPERGENHGAKRFAVLFLAADGHAAYDALFCQDGSSPPPFCVVLQDHGFGGNYSRWGGGGLIEDIALSTTRLPELLLIAENTDSWQGYSRCHAQDGSIVDAECQGGRMRALWGRDGG
jgi:hypothetical protein